MSKKNYYSLISGLPDLIIDEKKIDLSSVNLRNYLQEEIHPADFKLVQLFYLPYDHDNLLNLLFKDEGKWSERGNYSKEKLEQLTDKKQFDLIDFSEFPSYFKELIERYHFGEDPLSQLEVSNFQVSSRFSLLSQCDNKFVSELATFIRNRSNILLALNGRRHGLSYEDAVVGDDDISNAIRRSRARDFGLSNEIDDIEQIINIFEIEDLLEREIKLDMHIWDFIDEAIFFHYFSIERVLGFIQKLFIVERWRQLDTEESRVIFKQFLEALQKHFTFPEEFATTYGKRR